MDPVVALLAGVAALIGAVVGFIRLRREVPDLNEARLQRSVSQLEDMLLQYERDRTRFLQELERERGKVERLEQELEEERARATSIIAAKQLLLDDSLRRIAILEHKKTEAEETIKSLKKALAKHVPPFGGESVA